MSFKKRVFGAALSAGVLVASSAAMAQASGVAIDTTSTVSTINGLQTTISAIGAAVVAVVVVAYGWRVVKGFLGR